MRDERNHLDLIASHESVRALSRVFRDGGHAACAGAAGSSTALVVGAAARETARMAVLVVAHLDDADEVVDELSACGVGASKLPALEVLPGESGVSMELFAERIAVTRLMLGMGKAGTTREGDRAGGMVIVCPIQALMQGVPGAGKLDDVSLRLEAGGDSRASNSPTALNTSKVRGLSAVVRWLDGAGYRRTEAIEEPGDFAVRGGILDVFMPGGGGGATSATAGDGAAVTVGAVRVDFFGDDVESITEINLETMGSGSKLRAVELVAADPARVASDEGTVCFLELLPTDAAAVISETMEVTEQGRGYYERVTDARGIYGPPAVIKLLRERFHAFVEVNQFGGSRAGAAAGAGQTSIDLPARLLPEFAKDVGEAVNELAAMSAGHRVVVLCQNEGERSRLDELLGEFAPGAAGKIERAVRYLHRGFVWGEEGGRAESGSRKSRDGDAPLALVPYHELLHRYQARRRVRRLKPGRASEVFLDVQAGDYVVHTDHGIAQFVGLKSIKPRGVKGTAEERAEERLKAQSENLKSQISSLKSLRSNAPSAPEKGRHADAVAGSANDRPEAGSRKPEASGAKPDADVEEFLTLEFAGGTKLHVPVSQISKVQKYIGGFRGKPPLSTLGGTKWESQKNRVKESVRDLAKELLRVQAARESMPGVRYPSDTAWQTEFEAEFPYEETEDQLAALAEIKKDMGASRPMDRLLCGDVGYGKTELAIRAAFKAAEFGKQVAILVPTTILAEQHERTFRQRFADYPFRIASVSRFKSTQEVKEILDSTRKGQVDILIGTHRLLSKDVKFADLGLVIVDEEQRFGVEHKNALLALRMTVDVLTLSATPIPRTLHMAMLGLRDISSLATAPMDRRAIVTEVIPFNEKRIAAAIARELAREGQVYYVHNRVHNIQSVADEVQKMAPGARIVVGHGQMPDDELEQVMHKFIARQADILVATTIIESGIDIPTANTMIIAGADRFGLADLHQLRGRVGRGKHRAYCYLLLPEDRPVTDVASRRLRAIEEFAMLGAGFKIAMRDLEIRGAGNLLGAEQSGHIAAVGYDMYCRLLEEAAHELKREGAALEATAVVEIGVIGSLPRSYITSEARRLEAYRRAGQARTVAELEQVAADLKDAYGDPPTGAKRLFDMALVRIGATALGVHSISRHEKDVIFRCADPAAVERAMEGVKGTVRVIPLPSEMPGAVKKKNEPVAKEREVYWRPPESFLEPDSLLAVLRKRFGDNPSPRTRGDAESKPLRPGATKAI